MAWSVTRTIEAGAIVAVVIAFSAGLVKYGKMEESIEQLEIKVANLQANPQLDSKIADATKKIKVKIAELESLDTNSFSKLPVGSIVPFGGSLDQLKNYKKWKLCDGALLIGEEYLKSPFYNRPLPKLDKYYLKSTLTPSQVLTFGGTPKVNHSHSNPHTHPIPHTHSGKTSPGNPHNGPKKDDHHTGGNHDHTFTTGGPSNAASGNTSAPKDSIETIKIDPEHVKVLYIIKVI